MKTTPAQYELFFDMLESSSHFRENKITPDNPEDLQNSWVNLVKSLNASGGLQRSLPEWKRVFTDWKETGNKGEPEKDLTELENKLLYLTGDIVVEGMISVAEIGVENNSAIEIAVEEEK